MKRAVRLCLLLKSIGPCQITDQIGTSPGIIMMMRYAAPMLLVGLLLFLAACSQQGSDQPADLSTGDAPPPAGQAQSEEPAREIVPIAGDLYRAQDGTHFTVLLVTADGTILADPLNADFATWLEGELAQRFGVPVRYVLYSHYHWDHASGGRVFDDTATFVGHANLPIALEDAIAGFPVQVTLVDATAISGSIETKPAATWRGTSMRSTPTPTAISMRGRYWRTCCRRRCSTPSA